MTIYRQLTKDVEYVPNLADPDADLLERYRQRYQNTCSKQSGYILFIHRIVRVLKRKLSAYNGNLLVYAVIEAECLLPEMGQQVDGVVKQVFPQGWIVLVENCMKVFIPRVEGVQLQAEQPLQLRITQIRFQKGRYDGIGAIN
jgi:DNA-directed RNA polymerase subunit E'/Rpb7